MKALVLAGGFPQIALLKELNSRGISTVLADYYENPVAKPYADTFYRALYNEHWIYPVEEPPKAYKRIEGGCYWG